MFDFIILILALKPDVSHSTTRVLVGTLPFWRKPFLLCTTRNKKGHAVFMWVSPIARWLVALLHSRIFDQWLQPAKFRFSTNLYLKYLISNTITKAICKVMNFLISIPTDIIFATRRFAYYCTSFSANFPFLKKPFSLCIRLKIGRCVVKNWHQLTGHRSWANCSVALANLSKMSRSSLLNFIWSLIAGVLKQAWSLEFPLSRRLEIFSTSHRFSLTRRYLEPWAKISKL